VLRDGDRVRVDLARRRVDLLVAPQELAERGRALVAGGCRGPASRTPWEDLYRREVTSLRDGAVFERALAFQNIAQNGLPRDNH